MFKAWLVSKTETEYKAEFTSLDDNELPEEAVTVRVLHSSMNYKDALALTGRAPVVRKFPMVPGVDLAGIVEKSESADFHQGDQVILNGWGVGESHWGGLSELARVKADWLIKLPAHFTLAQSMAIGTAGYTAMLAILALERNGITPDSGEILVTGANGGVGGFSIAILSKLGYNVVASTGRLEESAYLKTLGANQVLDRTQLSGPGRALGKERWAAAIDNVGSYTLANICATLKSGGVVAACGMAQGIDFPATVAPFIVRGVTITGIDSVLCPLPLRSKVWERLSIDLDLRYLELFARHRPLSEALEVAQALMNGAVRGRVVIDVNI